jgi:hypothetical protein
MPIPGPSGTTINANTIQTEFGGSGPISLNEYYRSPSNTPRIPNPVGGSNNSPAVIVRNTPATLTIPNGIAAATPDIPAAQISYNDFLGTQNRIPYSITVSANAVDYNLYENRNIPIYAPGGSDIDVTIEAGVVLTASTTASAGLLIPSQFANGDTITIHNLGTIYGKGGNGGAGGSTSAPGRYPIGGWTGGAATSGSAGGAAVRAQRPVTIDNQGTIVGGGGGGGGGGGSINYSRQPPYQVPYSYTQGKNTYYATYTATGWDDLSGGSEGGGGGGGGGGPGAATGLVGGAGGAAGVSPFTPATGTAGTAGGYANGGPGGAGASAGGYVGGAGGRGGDQGAAGSAGTPGTGGNYPNGGGAAGAVGPYITGNPFVTWANNGTRIGAVS